jgi:DNA replication protein DnaC
VSGKKVSARDLILQIADGKTQREMSDILCVNGNFSRGYIQSLVSNLYREGLLVRVDGHNGRKNYVYSIPTVPVGEKANLPVWAPELGNIHWPTDTEMRELATHPQYQSNGEVCPTCGKHRREYDQVGTFTWNGQEYICPDDDWGHMRLRLAYRYWLANLPMQYFNLDWSTYPHRDAKEQVEEYLSRIEPATYHGMGFMVMGKRVGTGKSWTTNHVLKEVVKLGYSAYWMPFTDIASLYRVTDSWERSMKIKKLRESRHLVIDDVLAPGTDKQRKLFEDQWEEVIRYRTHMNFPTHISTNMEEEEIEDSYPRVYSLLAAKQIGIELQGEDARKRKVRDQNLDAVLKGERYPIT